MMGIGVHPTAAAPRGPLDPIKQPPTTLLAGKPVKDADGGADGVAPGSEVVRANLEYDDAFPDLGVLLSASAVSQQYVAPQTAVAAAGQLLAASTVPFPDELVQQFDRMELKCASGVFPELHRVWMTVDNALYLWDYLHPTDLARVGPFEQLLSTVALVRLPAALAEQEDADFLLVVATLADVQVVGVRRGAGGSVSLQRLPEYTVSAPQPSVIQIATTRAGRVFLLSAGGDIDELVLKVSASWRGGGVKAAERVRRSNCRAWWLPSVLANLGSAEHVLYLTVDDERDVLYGLTKANHIVVFDLGRDGADFRSPTAYRTLQEDYAEARAGGGAGRGAAAGAPGAQGGSVSPLRSALMSLFPVTQAESQHLDLVAVSASGVRFYFSLTRRLAGGVVAAGLVMRHVREAPPPVDAGSLGATPLATAPHTAQHYGGGVLLCAVPVSDRADALICVSPEAGLIRQSCLVGDTGVTAAAGAPLVPGATPILVETVSDVVVEGKIWALYEIEAGARETDSPLNTLLAELTRSGTRQFVVLTNAGVILCNQLRPADAVRHALHALDQGAGEVWGQLLQFFTPREVACVLVGIASGDAHLLPSGDAGGTAPLTAGLAAGLPQRRPGKLEARVQHRAKQLLLSGALRPAPAAATRTVGITAEGEDPRHAGLALYGARLLRKAWRRPLLRASGAAPEATQLGPSFQREHLAQLQQELAQLLALYEGTPALLERDVLTESPAMNERLQREHVAREALVACLRAALQTYYMVAMVSEHKVLALVNAQASAADRQLLAHVTVGSFLSIPADRAAVTRVIKALVVHVVSEHGDADAFSEALHRKCPLFFSRDEAVLFKAFHALRQAQRGDGDAGPAAPHQRQRWLLQALAQFKEGAGVLGVQQLGEVVASFKDLGSFGGATELVFAKIGALPLNSEAEERQREQLYELALEVLVSVLQLEAAAAENASAKTATFGAHRLTRTLAELQAARASVVQTMLRRGDAPFLTALFSFLFEQAQFAVLLELDSRALEQWLAEAAQRDAAAGDLWWKYLVRRRRYEQAAQVQYQLAQSEAVALPLERRLQYLASALANLKSVTGRYDAGEEELAAEIRWAYERGQIQQLALQALREVCGRSGGSDADAAHWERVLAGRIGDISELYNQVVKRYHLPAVALHVFRATRHHDPVLIKRTWAAVVEQASAGAPAAPWVAVASAVEQLAGALYPDLMVFPVGDVVHLLEEWAFRNYGDSRGGRPPVGWVADCLVGAQVPVETLREVYAQLEAAQIPVWTESSGAAWLRQAAGYVSGL